MCEHVAAGVAQSIVAGSPFHGFLIVDLDAVEIGPDRDVGVFRRTQIKIQNQSAPILHESGLESDLSERLSNQFRRLVFVTGMLRDSVHVTPKGDHLLFMPGQGFCQIGPPGCAGTASRLRDLCACSLPGP